jgi:hypothetical protein
MKAPPLSTRSIDLLTPSPPEIVADLSLDQEMLQDVIRRKL